MPTPQLLTLASVFWLRCFCNTPMRTSFLQWFPALLQCTSPLMHLPLRRCSCFYRWCICSLRMCECVRRCCGSHRQLCSCVRHGCNGPHRCCSAKHDRCRGADGASRCKNRLCGCSSVKSIGKIDTAPRIGFADRCTLTFRQNTVRRVFRTRSPLHCFAPCSMCTRYCWRCLAMAEHRNRPVVGCAAARNPGERLRPLPDTWFNRDVPRRRTSICSTGGHRRPLCGGGPPFTGCSSGNGPTSVTAAGARATPRAARWVACAS
jgi:hypothetical protein